MITIIVGKEGVDLPLFFIHTFTATSRANARDMAKPTHPKTYKIKSTVQEKAITFHNAASPNIYI